MAEDLCTYNVADGVATLAFNRPDAMNGMTGNMEVAYFERLEQAEAIIEVQKKVSELLGIPLDEPPNNDKSG